MLINIKNKIMENLQNLTMNQYSSNIVEKAIEVFDDESREKMIQKLCFDENLVNILNCKYGRFVIYKSINYMKNEFKQNLENTLNNYINKTKYKKKDKIVIQKFLFRLNNNSINIFDKKLYQ